MLLTKPVVLFTASWTEAVPPTGTAKVTPFVDERVKLSVVVVTVRFTVALCDVPPAPLAVPVTVMVCEPNAMLAAVVMVRVTVLEFMPSSVTLVGLKEQRAPTGKPAVQLDPVLELTELVKLMVWVEPFTGVKVNVAEVDCPAEMELGIRLPATSVKSLTVTTAGEEVESLLAASPSYVAVTLFEPAGSAVVLKVAVPLLVGGNGVFSVAVPKTVVLPLLRVEKLTVPTPVEGVTVALKVTLAPALTVVAVVEIVIELAVREADHAVKRAFASTEPRPVTWS